MLKNRMLGKLLFRTANATRAGMVGPLARNSTSTGTATALGPMLRHQNELPKLPVPPLKPSMEKYLFSLQPFLTEAEFSKSQSIVKEFAKVDGMGEKLHSLLVERANKMDNWLSDWWLQMCYLEFRSPVTVYSSPGLVFPSQNFTSIKDQLCYAVNLILAALDFKLKIDRHDLEAEKMGPQFLDMSQYENVFTTCRIPGNPSDSLMHYQKMGHIVRHIVVARNNNYFQVEVVDKSGKVVQPGQLLSQLQQIVGNSAKRAEPIGILTSQNRNTWSESYQNLISNPRNFESVTQIQKSIFMVCLDQADPRPIEPLTRCGLQAIHGNGINSGNRWHDKTLQFLISEDGLVGMTYEHSPAEGPPIARLMDHITQFSSISDIKMDKLDAPSPKELRLDVSDQSKSDLAVAEKSLQNLINDLDLNCFRYPVYGQKFIKSQKQSPDSYIQMAIQLAYFRLNNRVVPAYESASLRKFLYGRTDTIRSTSKQSEDFCKGMMDRSLPPSEKAAKLKEAISAHKSYVNDAVNGRGIDRLLLGLKRISIQEGLPLPDIFSDKGYHESMNFRLSTSQVSAASKAVMCYGAGVEDGYGCCYNPGPDGIFFGVSAYNSCPETSAKKFKEALESSLEEMHNVLLLSQSSKL